MRYGHQMVNRQPLADELTILNENNSCSKSSS